MKMAFVIIAMIAVAYQPIIAESTSMMSPLPWGAQLGICGMLGALLWWMIAKVLPAQSERYVKCVENCSIEHGKVIDKMSEAQSDCNERMVTELKGLRGDVTKHQSEHLDLLKATIAMK